MSATHMRIEVRWWLCAVAAAIFAVAGSGAASAAEVTGAADNLRTGWYPDQPSLAPLQITKPRFRQAFNQQLKGQIYAQPLVANGTLLVVTEENWAYGLDPVTGTVRWERDCGSAVQAGEEPGATIKCPDLQPRVGITGTPVIDAEQNVAYFVANRYVAGSSGEVAWYMNAIKLDTGEEVPNFPVKIEGEAQNLAGVKFVATQELQRPAMLMTNGVVYAGFGSHCDTPPYEGWIAGVSTSGQLATLWATSPHGGSIWQSGGGLVSDGPGQILFSTGNDSFEPGVWDPPEGSGKQTPEPEGKLGESVVRVQAQAGGELKTSDYFSPFNSKELDEKDLDLGSFAPVALPSPYFGNAKVPHLLVQSGKAGTIYVLNRDGLGGRAAATNNVVQELPGFAGIFGSAGVWPGEGGYVDLLTNGGHLHFFKYGEKSGEPALVAETKSSEQAAFGSGSPIITSNGATSGTGVLWITWCPKSACQEAEAELRAYNPASGESAKPLWQEKIGLATKFSRPGVSNGHIYIGNHEGRIIGFSGPSLTPSSESLQLAAPVGGQAAGEVTLTNTGSEIELETAITPTAPFQASGLPPVKTKLKPGGAIRVAITFKPSVRGPVSGQLIVVTEAGERKITLLGLGVESAQEKAEREAREKPAPTATTANFLSPPGSGFLATEPILSLTKLRIRARISRLGTHRRKLVISSYTLSAAGRVQVAIYRRVTGHRCQRGVRTCPRWVATRLKLEVAGHAGDNLLAVNLGTLSAGAYRLAAIPLNRSDEPGVTRVVEFRTFH
jgi:outer membrane protein assembly factor BamB